MNSDVDVKKREWVKSAAIVFLVIMVILTFFSNTIMNRSLPEVAAQYTQSSTITSRIRGSGTVTANEMYEVVVKQSYTVSEVRVRKGDEVQAGDILVVLSGGGNAELEATEEELRQAELNLERKLLANPYSSFASYHRDIQNARSGLSVAQERRNNAQNQRNQAQNTLNQARDERDAIHFDVDAYNHAKAQVNSAEAAVDKAVLELDIAKRELDTFDEVYGFDEDGETLGDETARNKLLEAYNAALQTKATAENALSRVLIDTSYNTHEANKARWDAANQSVIEANNNLTMANENLSQANQGVTSAQQSVDAANEALSLAQRAAGTEESLFDIEIRELNSEITALREKVEELQSGGSSSEITAAVGGKISAIDISPGQQTVPDKPLMIIEVVDMGYTLSVAVSAVQSSKVSIGDAAEVDRGYWSWGDELVAVLTGMRPNPEDATGGRLLVFSVSGDNIEHGTSLNITMAQRSETYGVVVPNSAIREDTNGTFVLIIETRSSPMRNRYIATRVDVVVIAADDTSSAISAAGLTGWDFVITTSTRPIEPGMEVRLTDNP